MGELDKYRKNIADPLRGGGYPEEIRQQVEAIGKAVLAFDDRDVDPGTMVCIVLRNLASSVTVKNTGVVPLLFTLGINGANNSNSMVGAVDLDATVLGDITMDGTDFLADEVLPIRGGVTAEVQIAGTQYPAKNLRRGYVPANGGAAGTPAEEFQIEPGTAVQVQFKNLSNITEYSYQVTLEAVENI